MEDKGWRKGTRGARMEGVYSVILWERQTRWHRQNPFWERVKHACNFQERESGLEINGTWKIEGEENPGDCWPSLLPIYTF